MGWLDDGFPLAIAHRGGGKEAEENTWPAFENAVALGYTHIETDVHATRDGAVVIHHDATLDRMTGDARALAEMTAAEVRAIRTHGGSALPFLAEVLERWPDLLLNIEPKSDAAVEPLARLLRRMGAVQRIGTGSFKPARTARLRALLGAPVSWSPAHAGVAALWLRGWGIPLPLSGFPVVQVPMAFRGIPVVTPRFVAAAHRAGIRVQVWTIDEAETMDRLLDWGVDGIMTDRPTRLKAVLSERGLWRGRDA